MGVTALERNISHVFQRLALAPPPTSSYTDTGQSTLRGFLMMNKSYTIISTLLVLAILAGCSTGTDESEDGGGNGDVAPAENEASAIGSMRTIVTAEAVFKAGGAKLSDGETQYGTLKELSTTVPPFIDTVLASGKKNGYRFTLIIGQGGSTYTVTSEPVNDAAGTRSFFADTAGILRVSSDGQAATKDSPALQ